MRHFPPVRRAALVLLLVLSACRDQTTAPVTTADPSTPNLAQGAGQAIPTRAQERPGTSVELSDTDLWSRIEPSGRVAVIGLKAPGAVRGTYQGRLLLNRMEWSQARQAIGAQRGVTVLEADTLLPIVEVRLDGEATLRAIRVNAMVDYIEPVRDPADMPQWASVGGCGWPGSWGIDDWLTAPSTGDGYSVRYAAMRISDAWAVGNGRGITIGLIDTGVASTQAEMRSGFAGGSVPTRTIRHVFLSKFSSADDVCGHGTRMAGAIGAPDDGSGVIGVAWGANMVNVRHADGVANVSSSDARASVRAAGQYGSRIVTMAWQSMNWWWQVSDEIKWWHYNRGVLFLGAAGTSGCGDLILDDNVVFPAEMSEVVAVTGIVYPSGVIPCGIHYGSEVELTAYLDVPTTGRYTGEVTSIGGSSNATGLVAGIAALVWQANPALSRDQLRQRLRSAGALYPYRGGTAGFGLVNAYRAVTGLDSPPAGAS